MLDRLDKMTVEQLKERIASKVPGVEHERREGEQAEKILNAKLQEETNTKLQSLTLTVIAMNLTVGSES